LYQKRFQVSFVVFYFNLIIKENCPRIIVVLCGRDSVKIKFGLNLMRTKITLFHKNGTKLDKNNKYRILIEYNNNTWQLH